MPTPIWDLIASVLPYSRCTLIYGPPGTGKTFAASTVALDDRPLYSVTMTPDTPAAELRGHYVPQGNQFVWQDGPALKAWRFGGRLVINEIDHAGGDTLSFLLACLDSERTAGLTLPTGENVRPHPRFQCVATMNGKPEDLPLALCDRFPVAIEIVDPHPEGVQALPPDLQAAANGTCGLADASRRITLRAWTCFASLRDRIGPERAADAVFGRRAKDVLDALKIAAGITT